jgi:hypothetical protein
MFIPPSAYELIQRGMDRWRPGWREHAAKRKNPWDFIGILLGLVLFPVFWFYLFRAAWLLHVHFYPAHRTLARVLGRRNFRACVCKQLFDGYAAFLAITHRRVFAVERCYVVDSPGTPRHGAGSGRRSGDDVPRSQQPLAKVGCSWFYILLRAIVHWSHYSPLIAMSRPNQALEPTAGRHDVHI